MLKGFPTLVPAPSLLQGIMDPAAAQTKLGLAKNNFTATSNPATTDNAASGYGPGSNWLNLTTGQTWRYLSESGGVAVWQMMDVADHPGYVAGLRYPLVDAASSAVAQVNGTAYFAPFMVKALVTPAKLGLRTNTAVSTAVSKIAIWEINAATLALTGTPIISYDGGGTGVSTAAANTNCDATLSASAPLVPGRLYLYGVTSNNSPVLLCNSASSALLARLLGFGYGTNAFQFTGYTATGITYANNIGSLNLNSLTMVALGGTNIPAVYMMP